MILDRNDRGALPSLKVDNHGESLPKSKVVVDLVMDKAVLENGVALVASLPKPNGAADQAKPMEVSERDDERNGGSKLVMPVEYYMASDEDGKRPTLNSLANGRGIGDKDLIPNKLDDINASRGGAIQVSKEANASRTGEVGTL